MLFGTVLKNWLETIRPTIKEQTYQRYRELMGKHIIPSIGRLPVYEINSEVINRFSEEKLLNGRLDQKGGLSPATVRLQLSIIRAAVAYAIETNDLKAFHGKVYNPPSAKKIVEVFSVKEQRRLESFLERDMDSRKFGILLALHTGVRLGELCGLQWNDVDFDASVITIQRTIQRMKCTDCELHSKTILTVSSPKTDTSYRILPMPTYLKDSFYLLYCRRKGDYVVEGNEYSFIDPRTYQYKFGSYLKQTNLPHKNFHVLRHTFATRCMEVGMDIKTISELLGHSNVSTTLNLYVHSSLENKRRQMELLQSIRGQEMQKIC